MFYSYARKATVEWDKKFFTKQISVLYKTNKNKMLHVLYYVEVYPDQDLNSLQGKLFIMIYLWEGPCFIELQLFMHGLLFSS